MIINNLEKLYKISFNYYATQKNTKNSAHLLGCMVTALLIFLIAMNFIQVIAILLHKRIPFPHPPLRWILVTAYMLLAYLIMFKVLNFSKVGDQDNGLFLIKSGATKKFIIFFLLNLILCLGLALLAKNYFKI